MLADTDSMHARKRPSQGRENGSSHLGSGAERASLDRVSVALEHAQNLPSLRGSDR